MRGRLRRPSPLLWLDLIGVGLVMAITLWELHPNLVFSSSLLTGGDTASHLALPAYLRTQGNLFNLTPWYPGWFDGMPAYTYYFVLPDYLATLASYVIGFAHAFKLATVLGSLLIPPAAYLMGRLFRAPRPIPLALAMSTLPFLFDASYTIDGGNLFSTMAGEYAFSLSLAFALVTIGLLARGVRRARGYWWTAVALSLTLAAHLLPWIFALGAGAVIVVFELFARLGIGDPEARELGLQGDHWRPVRFAVGAGLLSFGLSAWWLVSFGLTQNLTNSMGYVNDNTSSPHAIFTTLGWFSSTGAAGDRWVIVMAGVSLLVAFAVRQRLGMILGSLSVLSLAAFVLDPQSAIWNERLVPYWYVSIHLSAGWLAGYLLYRWAEWGRHRRGWLIYVGEGGLSVHRAGREEGEAAPVALTSAVDSEGAFAVAEEEASDEGTGPVEVPPPAHALDFAELPESAEEREGRYERRRYRAGVVAILAGLLSTVPGLVPPVASALSLNTTGNQVSSWAQWNYSGYQGKAAWPEYHNLMETMSSVAHRYGCGRAMWEYSSDQNRFGSPMALMLLPYWTNNCVDSMEGLFFESSPTVPYHFLDQAELSAAPSDPQLNLPYGSLDVALGVEHLQMLGVRYFMAFSPSVVAQANRDHSLQLVATTRNWPGGAHWRIYRVLKAPVVTPLTHWPNVLAHVNGRQSWQDANVTWWLDPRLWSVLGAASGPSNWPRAASVTSMVARRAPATAVSAVRVGTQSLSFHVTRLGTPVLVKVSYYPRWHVTGADGPYRVSPNLMVVVPRSHEVTLTYGSSPVVVVGNLISDATVLLGLVVGFLWLRRRRLARR